MRAPKESKKALQALFKPEPILLAGPALPGLLQVALTDTSTPDDLAPTEDVQITPAIRALAESLNKNPVKIYQWVRNNIQFIPTYGSIQGSDMTLQTKRGNAFDTASLLIALLRYSGIPARYAYGTIQAPIAQVMNWVGGVTAPEAALQLLGQGGIPSIGLTSGGVFKAVKLEHVWVEAYVDYVPSRGAVNKTPETWVPLDASFKQYQFTNGVDTNQAINFNQAAFSEQLNHSSVINTQESYVTNINPGLIQTTLQDFNSQLDNYLLQNPPPLDTNFINGKDITTQNFSTLVGTPSYKVLAVGNKFSTLPNSLRHYLKVALYNNAIDRVIGNIDLNYQISLPQLADNRLTLSYSPASAIDEQILAGYAGSSQTSLPAYLIQLKPLLKLSGQVVASGSIIGMGQEQSWDITFISPNIDSSTATNPVIAGNYTAIVTRTSELVPGTFQKIKDRLASAKSKLEAGDIGGLSKDDFVGEILHLGGVGYWMQTDIFSRLLEKVQGIQHNTLQACGLFSRDINIRYWFGIPRSATVGAYSTDIDINTIAVSSNDNDAQKRISYMLNTGLIASRFEGDHWDLLLNTNMTGQGYSATRLIELANQSGIPIYQLNSSNVANLLPNLNVSTAVKQDISNAAAAGKTITVPKQNLTINGWVGIGYVIFDPITGSGAYLISGGLNGGGFNISPEIDFLLGLLLEGLTLVNPLLGRLGTVGLATAGAYGSLSQIDNAKGLSDTDKSTLKAGVVAATLISLIPLVIPAIPIAGAIALSVGTIIMSNMITSWGISLAQRKNNPLP